MAQINVILWDVDGTLLDFSAAERRALEDCFRSFQMGPCTPELLARYSQINRTYWRRGAGGADQAPGPAGPL